nr:PREDICTED: uncharacterized protein LOC106706600 [Latimeria chalumnae]|eukprot:XP_014353254.1 PREDICTED: uncharacterized protein LOC106706600 [Latimeria chalumnae]
MGNGEVERFNQTLRNLIRALPPREKSRWPQIIQTLTFAYNCTIHETTGYAPFYLMFRRVPQLPVDVMFKNVLRDTEVASYDTYATSLMRDLKEAIELAQEHTEKKQRHQTNVYNRKVKGVNIEINDRVLLVNKGERGCKKLADRWESKLYTVIDKTPRIHVYKVKDPTTGQVKMAHRNLMMQANFLSLIIPEEELSHSEDISTEDLETLDSHDETELVPGLSERNSDNRTITWVNWIPDPVNGDSVSLFTEENPQSAGAFCASEINGEESDSPFELQSQIDSMENRDTENNIIPESSSEGNSIQSISPALIVPNSMVNNQPEQNNETKSIQTRVGRLVKPVNRLICNMTQQSMSKMQKRHHK